MICWYNFNKYLVCFEHDVSKCAHCSSVDDNTNSCICFTDNTSTCKWQRVGNSILVIMYDIQACTSGAEIAHMNKSLSIRLYNNCISLSNMLGKSVSQE